MVISHTPHYRGSEGTILGWGPTTRELDVLADLFREVAHIAPLHSGPPPPWALPYRSGVRLIPVRPAGGARLRDKAEVLARMPAYLRTIRRGLAVHDVVHIRCPSNISLAALLAVRGPGRPRVCWVKYAGNWQPTGEESWASRLQRGWVERNLHRGLTTINGRWPRQPTHVHSFHNPSLTLSEARHAAATAEGKRLESPFRLLFVGALIESKGGERAVRIVGSLRKRGIPVRLDVVGDGLARRGLEEARRSLGLEAEVSLHGWKPRPELAEFYARAHLLLLPSATEGWPKVLSEGMAYGAVPVAGAVSAIPQLLDASGAGLVHDPLDTEGFASTVAKLLGEPARWSKMRDRGLLAAQEFTFERYQERVRVLLAEQWGRSG